MHEVVCPGYKELRPERDLESGRIGRGASLSVLAVGTRNSTYFAFMVDVD